MGKTELLDRLAGAFTARFCDKCSNLMSSMCGSVVLSEGVQLNSDPFIIVDEGSEDPIPTKSGPPSARQRNAI